VLRRWLLALVVLCLTPLALSLHSVAGSSVLRADRYIVVLKDSAPATATGLGATIERVFGAVNSLVVSLSPRDATRLRNDRRVAFVTADRPVRLLADEADTTPSAAPTGVTRIGAASGAAKPDRRAAVAILDTGITDRPDLNVAGGVDCSPKGGLDGLLGGGRPSTADSKGHDTHVAGVVGARKSSGVAGVSPGTPLYAVRVFNSSGTGNLSGVICGLNWVAENAADKNIKVVNMSLGGEGTDDGQCGTTTDDAFHAAVCRVTAAGVTVVAAAGNNGADLAGATPAAYDEVLAVTAMADFDGLPGGLASTAPCAAKAQDDTVAEFSAWAVPGSADAEHTVAAPGVCITSTWNDGGTKTISGTSMAAPHVAGLVARCIDAGPCADLTPAKIIAKLRAAAAARPADEGFLGDPNRPLDGKYYGHLVETKGY
jgi:subtilisin